MEQLRVSGRRVDHILFGTSSGGTQAGIELGARITGFNGKLHGLSIDKNEPEHLDYESEDDLKSHDLSWLLHLVGDLHQALHCTTRVGQTQPDADAGGNRVTLAQHI